MKILIVSTVRRKITHDEPASRSKVIYNLAKGLAERGHDVTLVATADSLVPGVTLDPIMESGLVDMQPAENNIFREIAYLVKLAEHIKKIHHTFDIIHNHSAPDYFMSLIEDQLSVPLVSTVHIQPTTYVDETFALFSKTHLISISKAHKKLFKKAHMQSIVYNGIDTDIYSYSDTKKDYLLWLGRLSKAKNSDGSFMDPKGIRWAIQLARETDSRLLLSGNVEDIDFFNSDVKPYLNDKIQWIGPVKEKLPLTKKHVAKLMQEAKVFLMTINWYEPFGLVMAESMSCGTPVIGFDRGSVSEVIQEGKTGFVVSPEDGIDGLKLALSKINTIQSRACRSRVEKMFTIDRMVENYEAVYEEILAKKAKKQSP